jgi:YfiR/HmsC-like
MKKTRSIALLVALSLAPAFAQNYRMHSVFIYSFTRYVQWPDAYNQGDFEILVLGDSPILDELRAMAQAKKVGDRTIKVTKITSPAEIRKCNMLFVPMEKSDQIDNVIGKVNTQSILIVTEEKGLAAKGSDINFIVKDGKLAFELNQASMNRQGLKVSNELTRLAILI